MSNSGLTGAILAAGLGTRLRPITLDKPKCCVTVAGTSILEHQLRAYANAGVDSVVVIVGYLHDDVREEATRVASELGISVDFAENPDYDSTNNMYSLYQAADVLRGEDIILSNGDVVVDPAVIQDLATQESNTIACQKGRYSDEAMKVLTDESGSITHISKDISEPDAYGNSIDIYRFTSEFTERLFAIMETRIEDEGELSQWTELAIDSLLRDPSTDATPLDIGDADWIEVDTADDLLAGDLLFGEVALDQKEAVFFDLDGTLYLDGELVPGAKELVATLRGRGTAVYFLSNNSSGWKDEYAAKLNRLGIDATESDIILSTDGVLSYLGTENITEAYVVGTESLRGAIQDAGINPASENPESVVVGFDTELTYEKVRQATLAIRDGAEFLLAHPDTVCPTTDGFVPDCGAIGALVETATDSEPDEVFGKPNAEMIDHIMDERGLSGDEITVVGDRLSTDMQLAENVGADGICVLTGDATREKVESHELSPAVAPSVESILNWWL